MMCEPTPIPPVKRQRRANHEAGPSCRNMANSPVTKEEFIASLGGQPAGQSSAFATRPRALGVHHLKFAVTNLHVSIAWYERVLGANRIASLDHMRPDGTRFAVICEMVDWSGLLLELRQNPQQAIKDKGWDPITLSVRGRADLLHWLNWLDRWGTTHSPLLTGPRGWLVIFEDPDGRRIRLYTRDHHGGSEPVSVDSAWLAEP